MSDCIPSEEGGCSVNRDILKRLYRLEALVQALMNTADDMNETAKVQHLVITQLISRVFPNGT